MHKHSPYLPNTADLPGEHTRQLLEANDNHAQEELASLMNYLSLHIAGTSMSKSDAAVQSSMEPTSPSTGCGVSSNHGSSGEPGSTGIGSRSASQIGSGSGSGSGSGNGSGNGSGSGSGSAKGSTGSGNGSGSGSAKGSTGSGSGNGSGYAGSNHGSGNGSGNGSAGSDGYCGDGSTGSGSDNQDNISDGSDDPNDNGNGSTPKPLPPGRVRLPPGLVDGGNHSFGDMPMKVEVASFHSNLSHDHQKKNKSTLQGMLVMLDKITNEQQQAPTTTPSTSTSTTGLQAGVPNADFSPLGELLEKVLLQVARTSSGDETKTVCTALAQSLATLITQRSMAKAKTEEMDQNSRMLQTLQKEVERIERQRLAQLQFAQNQAPWQPSLDQQMMSLMQQELESQQMHSQIPSGIAAPSMAPPPGFPHAPGLGMRTQSSSWASPSSSAPPVAPPVTSQLQEEWRMRRLLRQELEKGWMQPEAQFITPEMINTGLQVSIEAAHQAAAAYAQEQASLSSLQWHPQANYGIQAPRQPSSLLSTAGGNPEALYASLTKPSALLGSTAGSPETLYAALTRPSPMPSLSPPGLGVFPHSQDMSGTSPLQPQMSDPSLQLPRHMPSSLSAPMLSGQTFESAPGMPMSVPLPSQTPSRSLPARKVGNDSGTKGQRKGAGKGNVTTSKRSRNAVQGMPGNAPVSNGSDRHAATPEGAQGGFDMSLRANLETLQSMDCNSIVQVRKINRLGFQSAEVLEEHFSKYGKVDRVLVSHCYAKARNLRYRPSGLGFVVMSEPAEVQKILEAGPEMQICREIDGEVSEVSVFVQAFKPQRALEADMQEGDQ